MALIVVGLGLVVLLFVFGILEASGFFRAVPLLLLLVGASFVAYMVVRANFEPGWARTAAILAPMAVLAWAGWRPAESDAKLWVMHRARFAMLSTQWLGLLAFGLTLPANGFRLDVWVLRGWPWLVLAAVAWGIGRLVRELVLSSAVRSGENMARLERL